MRFLFSKPAERVVSSIRSVTPPAVTSTASTQIIPLAERKWGQHCGDSCSCVLRFEVGVDSEDRVVAANYRAKRLVPSHQQSDANIFRSRRTGKIQMSNCSCDALHSLASQACRFSMGKRVVQIQNNLHSSPSIRRVALGTQNISPDKGSGCYNLVHATLMAAFEGRIPETVENQSVSSKPWQMEEDDIDDGSSAPIVEPSATILWWDRATQTEEIARPSGIFSAAPLENTQAPNELKPVDWVSYVDQIEEETA